MSSLRTRKMVLACFKSLHQARKSVFEGDAAALSVARNKINEEFLKHKGETSETKVNELIQFGREAEEVLRKTVVQARLTTSGDYELRITEDTLLEDNEPEKNIKENKNK